MRAFFRTSCTFIAAILLAMPAAALAQDNTDTATVSVTVIEVPLLLTLSATYTGGVSNVTTDGGTANGQLAVSVVDERPVLAGWTVNATMNPFTQNGVAVPALASTFMVVDHLDLAGPNTGGVSYGTINTNPQGLLSAYIGNYPTTVNATWSTAVTFPAGLEPGTYDAVLTFELIAGDPA